MFPYPTPTPVEFEPLGSSSPTAIIIAWVLTAFLPIPLILLITILRYSPDLLPKLLSWYPLLRQRCPGTSATDGENPSTPSSRTLTVSNRTSQTLTVPSHRPSTPARNGDSHEDPFSFSPRTPVNSLDATRKSPQTPLKCKTSPVSTHTPGSSKSNAPSPLASSFESPKRLVFLGPPSLLSSPRKKPYARLSDGSSPRKQPVVNPPASPRTVQRHRLEHRLLISAVLFGLVFAMYLLEGFSIAAAQRFAHARVLSQPNGKGGLGEGKEDERWLVPWTIYIFLQGAMVTGCAWMVWVIRRELRQSGRKWTSDKGKGVELGSVSPRSKRTEEEESFLLDGEGELIIGNDAAKAGDQHEPRGEEKEQEEEEPDWQSLGFHPTFTSSIQPAAAATSSPPSSSNPLGKKPAPTTPRKLSKSRRRPVNSPPNLHHSVGESSGSRAAAAAASSSPGSGSGSSSSNPLSAFALATSFIPENSGAWWLNPLNAGDEGGKNSWAQEEADLDHTGKGKGKEAATTTVEQEQQQEEDEEEHGGDIELQPLAARELLTGIDLSKRYRFSDGLAYPLLPLRPRKANDGGGGQRRRQQQQQQQQQPDESRILRN
ncbi:MAG: hypothetical protein Q9173_003059 [Seirophora scorigena]